MKEERKALRKGKTSQLFLHQDTTTPASPETTHSQLSSGSGQARQNEGHPREIEQLFLEEKRPTVLGRYQIIEEIGRGGMGIVYKAQDTSLQRMVALKVINREKLAKEEDQKRFLREAQLMARMNHPHLITIHDIGHDAGQNRTFFAMELIHGKGLDHYLEMKKAAKQTSRVKKLTIGKEGEEVLSTAQIVEILEKVAHAVHYAHEQKPPIIHRDLKPSNIMVNEHGEPKVMDLGLAKEIRGESQLSATQGTIGTVEYMSPEQAKGNRREIDVQSDVYSLGAILYEVLVGKPPFTGATPANVLTQLISPQKAKPPSRLRRAIPKDLEAICLKALEKDKTRRYQSALELAEDLNQYRHGKPVQARGKGGAPLGKILGGVALALLCGIVVWLLIRSGRAAPPDPAPIALSQPPPVAPEKNDPSPNQSAENRLATMALELARQNFQQENYRRAAYLYTHFLQLHPDSPVWFELGKCEFQRRQYESAIAALQRYLSAQENDLNKTQESLLWQARAHYAQGQYQEAVRVISRAMAIEPKLEYYLLRAECHFHPKAQDFAFCTKYGIEDFSPYTRVFRRVVYEGDAAAALRDLEKARQLAPDSMQVLIRLGDTYWGKEDRKNAVELYSQATDKPLDAGELLTNLGYVLLYIEESEKAREYFQKALRKNAEYLPAVLGLYLISEAKCTDLPLSFRGVGKTPRTSATRKIRQLLYRQSIPYLRRDPDLSFGTLKDKEVLSKRISARKKDWPVEIPLPPETFWEEEAREEILSFLLEQVDRAVFQEDQRVLSELQAHEMLLREYFERLLRESFSRWIKLAVIEVVGKLGWPLYDSFAVLLNSQDDSIAAVSIEALHSIGGSRAVELISQAAGHADQGPIESALTSLEEIPLNANSPSLYFRALDETLRGEQKQFFAEGKEIRRRQFYSFIYGELPKMQRRFCQSVAEKMGAEPFLQALKSPQLGDTSKRLAAFTLQKITSVKIREELLSLAPDISSPELQYEVAGSLIANGEMKKSLQMLRAYLAQNDRCPYDVIALIVRHGLLTPSLLVAEISGSLGTHTRHSALLYLSKIRDAAILPDLCRFLQEEDTDEIILTYRVNALAGMARLYQAVPKSQEKIKQQKTLIRKLLTESLQKKDDDFCIALQINGSLLLGMFADSAAQELLLQLTKSASAGVQHNAWWALSQIKVPGAGERHANLTKAWILKAVPAGPFQHFWLASCHAEWREKPGEMIPTIASEGKALLKEKRYSFAAYHFSTLAELYRQLGKKDKARELYQEAQGYAMDTIFYENAILALNDETVSIASHIPMHAFAEVTMSTQQIKYFR